MTEPRAQVETGMRALTAWAAALRSEDIPAAVLQRTALILADDVAAMIAARDEPELRRLHEQMLGRAALREATVFRGGRALTDRYSAAAANGAAADWCELDGGYRKAVCHAGLYTLSALLAEAEAERLPIGELLRAATVGYEVVARMGRAWEHPRLVLHPHASLAAVGAAAGVAAARRFDPQVFLDAVTSATSLIAAGPWNHAVQGALVRNVWPAAGAWLGLRSADWAQCGIGGLPGTPYDVYSDILGGTARPERLTAGLGEEWAVADGYHKIYACCQYAHSSVEAVLGLRADLPRADLPRAIRAITVEVSPGGLTLNNYQPRTTLAAKFSIPHAVAAALTLGSAGAEGFSSATLGQPALEALRAKVQLRPYAPLQPFPNDRPSRVTVELENGRRIVRECLSAQGGPDRPFAEADIFRKIRQLTEPVYPDFAGTMEDLLTSMPERMSQPWDSFLGRLLNGPA